MLTLDVLLASIRFSLNSPWCHIYASANQGSIGSDNGLSPIRRQAIIWTNADILLGPLWTNFNEIVFHIHMCSFKKINLKMSCAKWRLCHIGLNVLTHWGRVTHTCVNKLTNIGSDNGLSSCRRQAITWTNVGMLFIGPLGTNFNAILIEIRTFSFKKMHLKMSPGKWRPFCLGLNVLMVSNDLAEGRGRSPGSMVHVIASQTISAAHSHAVVVPGAMPVVNNCHAPSQYKDRLSQVWDSHDKDKTVARPSYL